MIRKVWCLAIAGLALPAMGIAAESAAEAARQCSQVLGERERLACYDRAFPAGPQTSALSSRSAPAPAAPAAPQAPAPAPAAPAAVASAADSFGQESVRRPATEQEKAAKAKEATSLTAQISELKETRPNVWRLTLDNGQIWQQMDMSNSFLPKVGNTLRIERGRFGGYSMSLVGETRSAWVRTNRLR